ncbi:hypothetical protein N5T66_04260 [Aliarcobacter cryaerophilus]|uniref:baseplate hub protein n=1 Tax=Aliarcobacter cryaerophilus TaxID=28198 RepID=UPI0021B4B36D|nr:hypothetical protein [Aliarcobacter cryaerophilus]MCT7432485.1 hypothetical protein [Aliarcobacter cryaerophilus]
MFDRFGRKYELKIITLDDKEITIAPELRITFDVTKSIKGSLNKATVQIYNLSQTNRDKIKKDEDEKKEGATETKPKDENSKRELPPDYMQFELKAGYSKIETIFKGAISIAKSKREGANFVTTIEAYDGLYDLKNSYTSKVVKGNVSSQIIQDMPTVKQGKITEQNPLLRPRVLVGNSFKLIEQNLEENETFYIDDGVIHIIKEKEVTSSYIPLVSAATGLLNSPDLAEKEVFFETQMNPLIKIGCLIQLESLYEKRLNGIYKVNTIHYTGDYAGSDWKQEVFCVACNDYKVVK